MNEPLTIALGPKALAELLAMYQGDTSLLSEIEVKVEGRSVQGQARNLRELVFLIRSDYDLELGFETVSRALKLSMLNAAARIAAACGPGPRL